MSPKKQKILMIEEDYFLRKIYKNKLTSIGFEFIEATNGEEGLNKLISEKPDLVLLDLILPKKNGFDVLIEIRKNKELKDTLVIILSVLSQKSDMKRGLDFGAQDYLVKSEMSLSGVVEKVKYWAEKIKKKRG